MVAHSPPVAPQAGRRNILITSALPYVNNVPHLGNLIGCVLSADVYARYCRLRDYNVLFVCGTDEYGTATENKAIEEKTTPKEICDKYHAIHKEIYQWFDIDFDKFGRTSTPEQTEICQAIFLKLLDKKLLFEDTIQQLYCENCNRFLADRFVEGTCPDKTCLSGGARGDQCDKCGKLLNPIELLDPRCKLCQTTPRVRDTRHIFLDLPKLKDRHEAYVRETCTDGGWSSNSIQTTNAWIRDGLKPRCITRDLKWGVPVPLQGFEEKVFYVWFDAPIGYISITASYTSDWEKWWKNPENVELVQFMGKDNVPFHTVIFPCTLLGTEDTWTLMHTISVTEYLNYESGKFSKSHGIGVFGNDAKNTKVPVEVWRYYLLMNRPEVSDAMFSWPDLQAKQNKELLNNVGNFVHRCLSFIAKPEGLGYGSVIPDAPGADGHEDTVAFGHLVGKKIAEYVDAMEKVKLKAGLKIAMEISSEGNSYLQRNKFWNAYKQEPHLCAILLKSSAGLVYLLATILEPFMPSFSHKVLNQLKLTSLLSLSDLQIMSKPWALLPSGHTIGCPEPIFSEMKDEEMESYRKQFAGSQAERAASEILKEMSLKGEGQKTKKDKIKDSSVTNKSKPKDLPVSIARLDIRVGRITEVKRHPDADTLYVESIDVGEAMPRTVVSGLVKYIPIDKMQDQLVCVLCNLKPATMRGIKSQAMVLAASNQDHTSVELVVPPSGAVVGERIFVPGFEGEADDVLNPKKKVWETVQPDLFTNSDFVATYKGVPFTTTAGVCKVSSIKAGSIK